MLRPGRNTPPLHLNEIEYVYPWFFAEPLMNYCTALVPAKGARSIRAKGLIKR